MVVSFARRFDVTPWRGWAWIVAFVFIVAAVPVSFYLGVGAMVGLLVLRGPAAGGGEGSQADAYTALLFGGPLGVLIGTGLVGWFALQSLAVACHRSCFCRGGGCERMGDA